MNYPHHNVRNVSYLSLDDELRVAMIDVSTGAGTDDVSLKAVKLTLDGGTIWREVAPSPKATIAKPAKKSVAVIEVKDPDKALESLLQVIAQSAWQDGVGVSIRDESELLMENGLDEHEERVREIYIKIKEQL